MFLPMVHANVTVTHRSQDLYHIMRVRKKIPATDAVKFDRFCSFYSIMLEIIYNQYRRNNSRIGVSK